MTNDPILAELHAVRAQMLVDAGGTLAGLVAKIQADQSKSGRVVLKTAASDRLQRSPGASVCEVVDQPCVPVEP